MLTATMLRSRGRHILVQAGDLKGNITRADEGLEELAARLRPLDEVPVVLLGCDRDGRPAFSTLSSSVPAPDGCDAVASEPTSAAKVEGAHETPVRPPTDAGDGLLKYLSGADAASGITRLTSELASAVAECSSAVREATEARRRAAALRRQLRSTTDRLRHSERRAAGGIDPTSSETAFLTAVRVEYARCWDESDRQRYPLARMQVGRQFLNHLRALNGLSVEKVIQVCAQVACQRAHEIRSRKVHRLRAGQAGAPARVRKCDGAVAWRCSLQDKSPSARRLHWWDVRGYDGRTIEFVNVGVHDDFSVPE